MRNTQFIFCVAAILLISQSCNDTSKPPYGEDCRVLEQQCKFVSDDTAITPTLKMAQLKDLYLKAPPACRNAVVNKVTEKVAKLAYLSAATDTATGRFLEGVANDEQIDLKFRVWTEIRLARYHLFILHNAVRAGEYAAIAARDSTTFNDSMRRDYHTIMAQINFDQSRFKEAAKNYIEAIALSEAFQDHETAAKLYSNFATLYNAMGNSGAAIALRKKALNNLQTYGSREAAYLTHINLGADYADLGNRDSATKYYHQALCYLDSGVVNPIATFNLYLNMGNMFNYLNIPDSTLHYFDLAQEVLKQRENQSEQMVFDVVTGIAYAKAMKDVSPIVTRIKSYIPILASTGDMPHVKDCYTALLAIAEAKKDYREAYNYLKIVDSINKELASTENKRITAELATKYEMSKKELQIATQQKNINRKNTQNTILLSGLVIVALGSGFIVSRTQLRRKKTEVEQQQQFTTKLLQNTEDERSRIGRELHDGITHELLLMKLDFRNGMMDVTQKADHIINEIRILSRGLRPTMLDTIGFEKSVEHLCQRIMDQQQVFLTCEVSYPNPLPTQDELQLFRIIQEAVNNIVKYAKADAAKLTIFEQDHTLITEIKDNGTGFNVKEKMQSGSAFGLQSILARANVLKGKASINSSPSGTIITIQIPLKTKA